MRVKWNQIEVGDYLVNSEVMVTAVYNDSEGLWVETTDGDCGYVFNPGATVTIERSYDE